MTTHAQNKSTKGQQLGKEKATQKNVQERAFKNLHITTILSYIYIYIYIYI